MTAPNADSTPLSFLEALATDRTSLHWERFLFLYQPLFERWLRQYPVPARDAHDLIQESLLVVVRRLPEFKHNGRTGAFRAWLKQILHYQVADQLRRFPPGARPVEIDRTLAVEDPRSDPDRLWDREHDREILRRLLQLTRPLVPPKSWEAFYRTAIIGEASAAVANELAMSLNAVYVARSRVLGHLRRIGRGLTEATDCEGDSGES